MKLKMYRRVIIFFMLAVLILTGGCSAKEKAYPYELDEKEISSLFDEIEGCYSEVYGENKKMNVSFIGFYTKNDGYKFDGGFWYSEYDFAEELASITRTGENSYIFTGKSGNEYDYTFDWDEAHEGFTANGVYYKFLGKTFAEAGQIAESWFFN